jgi:hypothetical protein
MDSVYLQASMLVLGFASIYCHLKRWLWRIDAEYGFYLDVMTQQFRFSVVSSDYFRSIIGLGSVVDLLHLYHITPHGYG